jgi:hypothetical protein
MAPPIQTARELLGSGVEEWVALRSSTGANVGTVETAVEFRRLERSALSRVGEIDRTERIEVLYDQQGTQLEDVHMRKVL